MRILSFALAILFCWMLYDKYQAGEDIPLKAVFGAVAFSAFALGGPALLRAIGLGRLTR